MEDNNEAHSSELPKHIEIETTSRCPINPPCIMCDRAKHKPNWFFHNFVYKDISDNLIEKLKPLLKNAESVSLHGVGEPLIYKRLFEVIEMINPKAYISFNSNGLLLDKEMINKILNSNIKEISFSLDASNKETYSKIRLNRWDKVINNIALLIEEKIKKNSNLKIILNMTLMKENFKEILDFIKIAKKINADGVDFWPIKKGTIKNNKKKGFNFYLKEQDLSPYLEELKIHLNEAKKLADINNIQLRISGVNLDNKENNLMKKCNLPWDRVLISVYGKVRICCHCEEIIGDLNTESIEDIWNNEPIIKIRTEICNGIKPKQCKCNTL